SASLVWKPRFNAAWNSLWASGIARAFAEEIGIPTQVLSRRERDRIDAILDRDDTGERPDEIAEFRRGQGAIDPPIPLSQLRVVVLRTQHDFERPGASHETCQMLHAARAGAHARCRLRMTENR